MAVKLYPHQEAAVEELSNGKVLWGGTGVGKTITAAAYYEKKEAPKDVFVITTAKKRDDLDWDKEFAKFGVGTRRDGTVAGVLTVDSWNNIHKYQHVTNAFFIFDEQRLVGSGNWTGSFLKIARSNTWILLSATPGDTWLDYIPLFVANGFYKNRTAFKDEHVEYHQFTKFPKVKRYNNVGRLVRLRNELLVEMPYERTTVREHHNVHVHYNKPTLESTVKGRWNHYEDRPLKDAGELFRVARRVVNSDPTRLAAVSSLLERHSKLIVFYNFDYELEMLRSLSMTDRSDANATANGELYLTEQTRPPADMPLSRQASIPASTKQSLSASAAILSSHKVNSLDDDTSTTTPTIPGFSDLAVAEWNGHKHEPIPKSDRWLYLVQYNAGAEGWNNTDTDAMCFYSLPYSYKQWHQAQGRIDRLNTPFTTLHYYTLKSDSFVDSAISQSLSEKRSFNESVYSGSMWGKTGI